VTLVPAFKTSFNNKEKFTKDTKTEKISSKGAKGRLTLHKS